MELELLGRRDIVDQAAEQYVGKAGPVEFAKTKVQWKPPLQRNYASATEKAWSVTARRARHLRRSKEALVNVVR
eukprot:2974126-Pyramimonas_sp.AAC.1